MKTALNLTADRPSGIVTAVAWASTLLMSSLPLVIARELFGADIAWITGLWIGAAIALFAFTYVWPAIKPLRGYFAVMGIVLTVTAVLGPLLTTSAIWKGWFAGAGPLVEFLGYRAWLAVQALVVLAALALMGNRRQDVFLTKGDLNAPTGLRLPGQQAPVKWMAFGVTVTIVLAVAFSAFMLTANPLAAQNLGAVLPLLPIILASAMLNAFGEEFLYRAAPLSQLWQVVGKHHAVWMTAFWFGIGHFYGGIPSGVFGLVYAGLLGALLGYAMVQTRGMGWPWFIHFVIDVIIIVFIAASTVSSVGQ
jgi:membrane protease YdiL (CAAX protease family)